MSATSERAAAAAAGERILVGLDGSPRQDEVLAAACALAEQRGATLVLFRAVSVPATLPPLAMPPLTLPSVMLAEARAQAEAVAAGLPPGLVAAVRVDIDVPWQGICDAAREEDVALIVIGSHGYGGLDRILGTTAAKVVNHADRSVLVVRASPAAVIGR